MDFFAHQDEARKNTAVLISLYSVAIVLIIAAIYAVLWVMLPFLGFAPFEHFWDMHLFVWVVAGTLTVVIGGSLYRISVLADGGGEAVARMVGGAPLDQASQDPLQRRLLNVVAEMAIAAGTPVPPVFVLPQSGINAFAAGFSPSEAVVGVTQGAMELLNRDELQGVIAHEFSHILNGDMRMKMKLMGLLHGITLIGDVGISLMTTRRARVTYRAPRSGGGSPHLAVIALGLLLFMVGTTGLVFGDLIKRAVSRQREFLADALAVQFTRNPGGIAGALKVIGGYKQGARIDHPGTNEASHFFFGSSKKRGATNWWASHPPLAERIRRIDPRFSGVFDHVDPAVRMQTSTHEAAAMGFAPADTLTPAATTFKAANVLAHIGNPSLEHLKQAKAIAAAIPKRLQTAAEDAYMARAAVYSLLLDNDAAMCKIQLGALESKADPNVFRETLDIQPEISKLTPELRLPLLDMLMPTLRQLSEAQYKSFRSNIHLLIRADKKLSLFEYTLQKILLQHLDRVFGPSEPEIAQYHSLQPLLADCVSLIALLALVGHKGAQIQQAFTAAMQTLDRQAPSKFPDKKACGIKQFDTALDKLRLASPHIKRRVLSACVICASSNGLILIGEAELLRAISAGLDCPMPPFLPGQVTT